MSALMVNGPLGLHAASSTIVFSSSRDFLKVVRGIPPCLTLDDSVPSRTSYFSPGRLFVALVRITLYLERCLFSCTI